jgi:hypothetical protein
MKKKRSWKMWATINKETGESTWCFPSKDLAEKYCNDSEKVRKVKVTKL